MPKIRHVIRRSHLVREDLEADVDLPADQAPVRSSGAELRRFRALVGMGPRDPDSPDARPFEGRDEISGRYLPHELAKNGLRAPFVLRFDQRYPPAVSLGEGLIPVDPPKTAWCLSSAVA